MNSRLTIALSLAASGLMSLAPAARAQVRGMRGFSAVHGTRIGSGRERGGAGFRLHERRSRFGRSALVVLPYSYEDEWIPPEQPPVWEPPPQPAAAAPAPVPAAPPAPSLLLEYRGGQWVRVPTGAQLLSESSSAQPSSAPQPKPLAGATNEEDTPEVAPPPRAVLVFRDGHKQELEKYVIEGNVIYASENYWATGAWTKEIPISALNVPATLLLNEQRGSKFRLPTGPSEIVVGL